MKLQWSKDYELGHQVIDAEHKEIFALVQNVFDIKTGTRKEKVDEIVSFLINYTVQHFRNEENLMAQSAYPQTELHKKQHSDFAQAATDLHKRIMDEGDTISISVEVNKTVVDWLITHVLGSDKLLADHYKQWKSKA